MKRIFNFFDCNTLYKRCIIASIAHAIMVGEYDMLSAEQSWENKNYNFQNMENIRGVISFSHDYYVCVIQNNATFNNTIFNADINSILSNFFQGADEETLQLARTEALLYMLVEENGKISPFISAAFWGKGSQNFSNQNEEDIIAISENTLLPLMCYEEDAKKYWKDYYEMNKDQYKMMESLYNRRITTTGPIKLMPSEKEQLTEWFGNINECLESFAELNIL